MIQNKPLFLILYPVVALLSVTENELICNISNRNHTHNEALASRIEELEPGPVSIVIGESQSYPGDAPKINCSA